MLVLQEMITNIKALTYRTVEADKLQAMQASYTTEVDEAHGEPTATVVLSRQFVAFVHICWQHLYYWALLHFCLVPVLQLVCVSMQSCIALMLVISQHWKVGIRALVSCI